MTHSAAATLRARTGFALLAVAAVVLTACTGVEGLPSGEAVSGGAGGTPTESTPQMSGDYVVGADGKLLRPTHGPTPIAPTPPASITEDTTEAAEEFARYFVAVAEYAWNSGDTTELRAISTADCEMCTAIAEDIDDRTAKGGWSQGLTYDITETEPAILHPDDASIRVVVLHISTSGVSTYDGSQVSPLSVRHELVEVHTCPGVGGWQVCGGVGARDPEKT